MKAQETQFQIKTHEHTLQKNFLFLIQIVLRMNNR